MQESPEGPPEERQAPVLGLLAQHVPICLLVDLAVGGDPRSAELLDAEGRPEQPWWEDPA